MNAFSFPVWRSHADERSLIRASHRESRRLSWPTIATIAALTCLVDGFWVTSLRGAIGTARASQNPFRSWLYQSLLLFPIAVFGVFAAFELTRRWKPSGTRLRLDAFVAALACVAITTLLGISPAVRNSISDYRVQSSQLRKTHAAMATPQSASGSAELLTVRAEVQSSHLGHAGSSGTCTGVCAALRATRESHVRALGSLSALTLLTNVVIVAWVAMARGGRLWRGPANAAAASDSS